MWRNSLLFWAPSMSSAILLPCDRFIRQLLSSNSLAFLICQVSTHSIQECSPTDGKAEAPEGLRHSLKVTQHTEAELGSAFLAGISQNVSAQILRQLFGLGEEMNCAWS